MRDYWHPGVAEQGRGRWNPVMTDSTDQANLPVLALVRDLMFSSKIIATAREMGVTVKIVRDPAKLAEEAGGKLLVDLNQPGTIESANAWMQRTGARAIGFASHVDTATIQSAKDAGFSQVLARSQFTARLGELLLPD